MKLSADIKKENLIAHPKPGKKISPFMHLIVKKLTQIFEEKAAISIPSGKKYY